MKNKKMTSLIGYMLLISVFSIVMAGTAQQLLFMLIGFLIMFGVSYFKPSFWIKNVEVISIIIFLTGSLKGYFNCFINDASYLFKWESFRFRMITFLFVLIPLGGIWIYKKCQQYRKEHLTTKFLFLALVEVLIIQIIVRIKYVKAWLESFSKTTEYSYTYDVLKQAHSHFRICGDSTFFQDILSYLPEAKDTLVLTYYISKYGIIMGGCVCIMIVVLIIKVLCDFKLFQAEEVILGKICAFVILFMMIFNILMNFRLIPFVSHRTFLPFFSHNFGENIFVFLLMGIILGVYRCYLNLDES